MKRPRRVVRLMVLSLLLGVVTTYGVAWLVMNTRAGREIVGMVGRRMPSGRAPGPKRPLGMACVVSMGELNESGAVWAQIIMTLEPDEPKDVPWSVGVQNLRLDSDWDDSRKVWAGQLFERAAGWPCKAVVERIFIPTGGASIPLSGRDMTLRLSSGVKPSMGLAVALLPIWPGFAVDVGVFWLGWFVLIGGVRSLRGLRRHRAELCAACGYEMVGLMGGVCPECGSAVKGM